MALELRHINKRFGPVRASDDVSLVIERGTLHGLLGENGAGKSTLMRIVTGFYQADSGEILLDGDPIALASPDDAIAHGIGMLHQDPLVFLPFTVLDNFVLGAPGRVNRAAARAALAEYCDRFGFTLDPDSLARALSVGERQQLEIVRLLWLGARVLILDEPTSGISEPQRLELFAALRQLATEGMSVIFVSHKLEEIEELCQRVSVLRSGKLVGEADMPVSTDQLVAMMFGAAIEVEPHTPAALGDAVLEVDHLVVRERLLTLNHVSFQVHAGEVIGLAGLEGSGQRTLLRACAGLLQADAGRIVVGGSDVSSLDYRHRLARGVQYLAAGRLEEGLVAGLSITEHLELARRDHRPLVDWAAARHRADEAIGEYSIKGRPESNADDLSGGNQQRLLLAMLRPELRVLLMEHPTRGLDIESANWVWHHLLERRAEGTGIVFASADLEELLRYADRILVFFSGRMMAAVDSRTTSVPELGYLIAGKAA
jgi:simple sugar transport system ATP-binding protein